MIPRFSPFFNYKELLISFNIFKYKGAVSEFEKNFAAKANSDFALSFGYGRTAIIYALKALGIKDKLIICPTYTCVVVAHAIKFSRNTPIFVDCSPGSFNMDCDKIEDLMRERGSEVGGIIFTSIFGEPVNLDYVTEFKKRYPSVKIIQDCAHSFFARWNNIPVQNVGDVAIYGLNVSKIINAIFGGMLTTNDADLYSKIRNLRGMELEHTSIQKEIKRVAYLVLSYFAFMPKIYSVVNWLDRSGFLGKLTAYYDETVIDMPKDYLVRMGPVSALVGIQQLNKYEDIIKIRRECAKVYFAELKNMESITLPQNISGHTFSHFTILVPERDKLITDFLNLKIQLGWLIEYSIPYMKSYVDYKLYEYPVSRRYSCHAINLPVYNVEIAKFVSQKLMCYFADVNKSCKEGM